jgi:hypothetical protein
MSAPYIPPKDADFANWLANFSTMITASPATYGLTAGDATTIAAQDTAFQAAYTLAVNPSTRTPATVAAKDAAKVTALGVVRPYAQRIANNAGVSPSNKVALGLNPRTNPPTPITAPTTNPIITIPSMIVLGLITRMRDSLASPSVKAKPAGAIAMELYAKTSATPITDPTQLVFIGLQTKSPFTISFDSSDGGKQAYIAGRWVTRTGLVGPWSAVVTATVPAA